MTATLKVSGALYLELGVRGMACLEGGELVRCWSGIVAVGNSGDGELFEL